MVKTYKELILEWGGKVKWGAVTIKANKSSQNLAKQISNDARRDANLWRTRKTAETWDDATYKEQEKYQNDKAKKWDKKAKEIGWKRLLPFEE